MVLLAASRAATLFAICLTYPATFCPTLANAQEFDPLSFTADTVFKGHAPRWLPYNETKSLLDWDILRISCAAINAACRSQVMRFTCMESSVFKASTFKETLSAINRAIQGEDLMRLCNERFQDEDLDNSIKSSAERFRIQPDVKYEAGKLKIASFREISEEEDQIYRRIRNKFSKTRSKKDLDSEYSNLDPQQKQLITAIKKLHVYPNELAKALSGLKSAELNYFTKLLYFSEKSLLGQGKVNFVEKTPAVVLGKNERVAIDLLCSKVCKRVYNYGKRSRRHVAENVRHADEVRLSAFKDLREQEKSRM